MVRDGDATFFIRDSLASRLLSNSAKQAQGPDTYNKLQCLNLMATLLAPPHPQS